MGVPTLAGDWGTYLDGGSYPGQAEGVPTPAGGGGAYSGRGGIPTLDCGTYPRWGVPTLDGEGYLPWTGYAAGVRFLRLLAGGLSCYVLKFHTFLLLACTIAVGLIEQSAIVNKEPIENTLTNLCKLLPTGTYEKACEGLVDVLGPAIIVL